LPPEYEEFGSMLDIKLIRDNPQEVDRLLALRGVAPHAEKLLDIDARLRAVLTETQEAQAARNDASKAIGKAKASGDEAEASRVIEEVARLKTKVQDGEEAERTLGEDLKTALSGLPNLPAEDVPPGKDEADNVERGKVGTPRTFNFAPKEHWDLGEKLGLMDFETAAKMAGSRFVLLRGQMARLERAIANFMLDIHTTEFGYTEVSPPFLVRDAAAYGTAQLPKFHDDLFHTEDGFWLIPTAEVPLTNMVAENILSEDELPLRMTAFTPCFRREAGSAGRDQRGMIRVHQFSKVELVSITTPEKSAVEHERMLSCAEEILKRLDIAYRVMKLCAGDMGFAAKRTFDIEVWLPGQDTYREISSCSVCDDFQARRMNARYRPTTGKGTRFVHTLNGSGLATGRTLIAILENYQTVDGGVEIPEVLRPYMGGLERIDPVE
jgi:seryl-tRNA synthetase